jgi:hypothetical protein
MEEIYKSIDGYDYEVSNIGNVRNKHTCRILKQTINNHGYNSISLYKNKIKKTFEIHRIVANAFIENTDNKPCVDHIDNNKLNNIVSNLRFATIKENNRNTRISKRNTSGIKGVSFSKCNNKWESYIYIDGIKKGLGYFNNIDDAKKARVDAVNRLFGDYVNACERI